ncbi:MAG: ABC transporter permease [Limisphaerales bacterium]
MIDPTPTDATRVRFGEALTRTQEWARAALTSGPGIAWVTVFLLVPMLGIVAVSFVSRGVHGELVWDFTLANFKRLAGFGIFGFEPLYPKVVLRSLAMAAGTTLLCALAALPLTFFIAALPVRRRRIALTLVVIPFWTNLLIRTYAWQIVLSADGWLARSAAALGWIQAGTSLYPGTLAVFVGLTCDFLPFLALPLYASVEKIDWSLAEAASDLGANVWHRFRHALLPQIAPGLAAGSLLVFIAATGQFVIPDLLGGAKTVLLGNAIQQQFGISRDWPFGSAMACVSILMVLAGLAVLRRISSVEKRRGSP